MRLFSLCRVVLCSINFLITIPMVCNGGVYLVNLLDNVMSGYPVLIIALCELLVISYVYGNLQHPYRPRHFVKLKLIQPISCNFRYKTIYARRSTDDRKETKLVLAYLLDGRFSINDSCAHYLHGCRR